MKKFILPVFLFTALTVFYSCGGGEKKSTAKVSAEMQDFMNNLNGKSASVASALQQFGKEGLDTKDMGIYDLANPKVLETNGNCYLIECKSGMTKRKYNLCWEGGKISSIEDKGMESFPISLSLLKHSSWNSSIPKYSNMQKLILRLKTRC